MTDRRAILLFAAVVLFGCGKERDPSWRDRYDSFEADLCVIAAADESTVSLRCELNGGLGEVCPEETIDVVQYGDWNKCWDAVDECAGGGDCPDAVAEYDVDQDLAFTCTLDPNSDEPLVIDRDGVCDGDRIYFCNPGGQPEYSNCDDVCFEVDGVPRCGARPGRRCVEMLADDTGGEDYDSSDFELLPCQVDESASSAACAITGRGGDSVCIPDDETCSEPPATPECVDDQYLWVGCNEGQRVFVDCYADRSPGENGACVDGGCVLTEGAECRLSYGEYFGEEVFTCADSDPDAPGEVSCYGPQSDDIGVCKCVGSPDCP